MATTLAPRPKRDRNKQQSADTPSASDSGASAGMPLFMSEPAPGEYVEEPPVAVAAETIVPAQDVSTTEALATPNEPKTADAELEQHDLEATLPDKAPPGAVKPKGEGEAEGETEGEAGKGEAKPRKGKDGGGAEKEEGAVPVEGAAAASEVAAVFDTGDSASTAMARADASVGMLGEVGGRATAVGAEGVGFAPAPDEVAAGGDVEGAREQRATAESMASGFLAQNSAQIQAVLGIAQTVPTRIASAAESAKANVDSTIESARSAVTERCASARMEANAAAAGARGRIVGEYAATVAAVTSTTLQSRAAITASRDAALMLVTLQETSQIGRISTLYSTKDPVFRAAGTTVGDEAVAHGNKRKWEWLDQRDYESPVLDGPVHDNRLKARADAAVKVAAAYQGGLIEQANKEADAAQLGMPKDLVTISQTAAQSRTAINSLYDQATAGLDAAQKQALSAAAAAKGSMLHAVRTSLRAALKGIATEEETQVATLAQFGESQKIGIDRDAAAAVVGLVEGVSQAAGSLTDALAAFSGATRSAAPPPADALAVELGLAQADFDGMASMTLGQLELALMVSESGIANSAEKSASAANAMMEAGISQVTAASEAFVTSAQGIGTGAATSFASMRQSHAAGAAQTTVGSLTGFLTVNAAIAGAFDETAKNLDKNFETAAKSLTTGLRQYLNEKLDGDINKHADEAAAQVQPRWKSVLKVLLVIAIILVVALVAGPAVIGAIGAAAGALGASAATAAIVGTVVGGAIVGAASGAVIQIGNNVIDQIGGDWSLGKTFEGVGNAMIVGAIGGGLGGLGSVLGKGASALFSSGFGKLVVDTGINLVGDVAGGILGDLAVGNPITLEGVLIGAGIGLGVGIAGSNLGKLGKFGKSLEGIQGSSMKAGEGLGAKVGKGLGAKLGIKPKINVEVAAPKAPKIEQPAPKAKVDEPAAPKAKIDEPAPKPKIEEPAPKAKIEEPAPKPKVDEPGAKTKADEPSEAPRSSHDEHPEIEEGVVAKEKTGDGHEVKVLKDGRTAVCSDCATIRNKYSEELDGNPGLKKRLDQAEALKDPKLKAKRAKAIEAELKVKRAEAKAEARAELVDDAKKLIGKNRKFSDPDLEARYQTYRDRKDVSGGRKRGRADWKVESDYWLNDSPTARGNAFNKTASDLYPYNEVHLANGKRCDSYDPDANGGKGEIISRKAVDFDSIDESSFKGHLAEMKQKYRPGEPINSPKYGDTFKGQTLKGDFILEVPATNKGLPEAARFEALAKQQGVTIRYTSE